MKTKTFLGNAFLLHYKKLLLLFILAGAAQQVSAQKNLKIISYNILEGMKTDTTKGKQLFTAWIKSHDPDILALQEANKFTQATLEELAHSYGHPYAVLVKEKGYPTAITSKYPIVNVRRVTDNMTHGFIMCQIKDLNVVVLHLNPHLHKKRDEEIDMILTSIAQSPSQKKWMIMGDFNSYSPLDQENYNDGRELSFIQGLQKQYPHHDNLIEGKYLDFNVHSKILAFGFKDAGKTTAPADVPKKRIDFIYLTKDLISQAVDAHFIRDDFTARFSDHKPVIMELKHNR